MSDDDYKPDDHDGSRVTDWLIWGVIVSILLFLIFAALGGAMLGG